MSLVKAFGTAQKRNMKTPDAFKNAKKKANLIPKPRTSPIAEGEVARKRQEFMSQPKSGGSGYKGVKPPRSNSRFQWRGPKAPVVGKKRPMGPIR